MSDADSFRIISAPDLIDFTTKALVEATVTEEHALLAATILVEADLRRIHSHGVNRLDMYCNEVKSGVVSGSAKPKILKETVAIAHVDGQNGLGCVVGDFCMKLAIKKAKEVGIGWVVAKGSNHYGIAGYYSDMATKEKCIGASYTNTSPLVFPTRANKAALGTNPIAVSAPATNDHFRLDMATSTVPVGKVEYYDRKNEKIPSGWAVDKNGRETNDPKEMLEGGGLLPLGGSEITAGYKGYGLASMVELFCGILGGASYGTHIGPWRKGRTEPADLGQCFVAISTEHFAEGFDDRMANYLSDLRGLPRVDQNVPVLVPGDPETKAAKEQTEKGISLHVNLAHFLEEYARTNKLQPPKFKN
eukprot:TRINITY_DN207_c0_g1_i2.p1 TRINITY_DN207_c0_g1~~TRINITY_DN207_c0_g1_i2.p1  ORF type:complete len:361 (-),score=60.99 TRINITY_DN207_c0_g1_i2:50-1132(-)